MNDSNQNISQDFSDDEVRRFLLGQLSADEQPRFEQGLFLDSELEERVRLAEFDLADDYACSRLHAEDRARFEQRFLAGDDRKLKLNVSNVLRDRFAVTPGRVRTTPRFITQLQDLLNFNRPIVKIAFGVVMLLITVGGAWIMIKNESRIKDEIKRIVKIRRPQPPNVPRDAHHAPNNSAPEHRETPSTMPDHERTTPSPTVETLSLSPEVLLESGKAPSINLPAGAHDIVRLELAVKSEPSALYQAQLSTIEGQTVITAESLKATEVDGQKIDFDAPVALLKAGDYRITLSRVSDTSNESVVSYYFRVTSLRK
ncbi:MAG: hypothetical protein ACRD8U_05185 [Pyrinomonadaceae bacterium]